MNDANTKLIREFVELKSLEKKAYNLYDACLIHITEPSDKEALTGIMKDEIRHEAMVQEIIDILKT